MPNFAERLQEQLADRRISPEQLGRATGFSNSNIYKWLRNESFPTMICLIKLSDYFKCTADFLSGRSTENHYFATIEPRADFTERLRGAIKAKHSSSYKFAKAAKISRATLHHWSSGYREPLLDNLVKLADYVDCTLDYLIGREN